MAILFVGNGINLKEKVSTRWDELLASIYSQPTKDVSDAFGNTMRYEYIDSQTEKTGYALKCEIAEKILEKADNIRQKGSASVHYQLMSLPVRTILTTNYDYALELSKDHDFQPKNMTKERLYSLRRYQQVGNQRVYHIHGECSYPNSICLGFEHYAGTLEKMRGPIVRSSETKNKADPHKFHLYDVLTGLEPASGEWYYQFFQDDVYFLGFGFDSSEEDIWWLLTYRAGLMKKYPELIKNHIYYVDTSIETELNSWQVKTLRRLLAAFSVEVIPCAGETYTEKYDAALGILRSRLPAEQEEKDNG